MITHEDKRDLNDTTHSGKLAAHGKKAAKKHTNRKTDKFQKAKVGKR